MYKSLSILSINIIILLKYPMVLILVVGLSISNMEIEIIEKYVSWSRDK